MKKNMMTRLSVCSLGVSCNEMIDTPMLLVVGCYCSQPCLYLPTLYFNYGIHTFEYSSLNGRDCMLY